MSNEMVSRFGEYSGYSEPAYDGWIRSSQHVEARDGTRLAVDMFRPTRAGALHGEPLPVIWSQSQYRRALFTPSGMYTVMECVPQLQVALQHGYAIAIADARGTGASFGHRFAPFTPDEARDAYDLTEWFAAQSWCDGNIGMYWNSYMGMIQHFAASERPPHLRAIFPEMASIDLFDGTHPGGIFFGGVFGTHMLSLRLSVPQVLPERWRELRDGRRVGAVDISPYHECDMSVCAPKDFSFTDSVVPVDEDEDGSLLAAAQAEHAAGPDFSAAFEEAPFRDTVLPGQAQSLYYERSLLSRLDAIRAAGIPAYQLCGWFDCSARHIPAWLLNYHEQHKMVIGPWFHNARDCALLGVEQRRWFDYWLKGIDNGIMDEPPVHYAPFDDGAPLDWRPAEGWPLAPAEAVPYFLVPGPSGSIDSVNDGGLESQLSAQMATTTEYQVDYRSSIGFDNRWTNAGLPCELRYPDLREHNRRGLTFTTAPLPADTEVTGQPMTHLWVSSSAPDGDFYVYLTAVDDDGCSTYLSEGQLRASVRGLQSSPYAKADMPYHRAYEEDVVPLVEGEPVELEIEMEPISVIVRAGTRLRLTVTGADYGTFFTPEMEPAPTVRVHHDSDHPSRVILPVVGS